jgi:hypothetical protein
MSRPENINAPFMAKMAISSRSVLIADDRAQDTERGEKITTDNSGYQPNEGRSTNA